MAWSDAARKASAETRRAHAQVRLGKWNATAGTGLVYPAKGTFARESVAERAKALRAWARGSMSSAQAKKRLGPMAKPPTRLSGAAGAKALNAFAASGYKSWKGK